MTNDCLRVALLGCGNVGTGVVDVLARNDQVITERAGIPIRMVGIAVRDLNKPRSQAVDRRLLTDDAAALIRRAEVDCVAECIGGLDPAYELVLAALEAGKSVVTSNKELVARRGKSLFGAADAKGVDLLFEGSVAGGIPVIHALKESLAANEIEEIVGIE